MRRIRVKQIDPTRPLMVRKAFTFSGVDFLVGDEFIFTEEEIGKWKFRRLVEGGKISQTNESPPTDNIRAARQKGHNQYKVVDTTAPDFVPPEIAPEDQLDIDALEEPNLIEDTVETINDVLEEAEVAPVKRRGRPKASETTSKSKGRGRRKA